ncbi:MAG: pentapeptide repeat-containing protein, partial [Nakamurella sp.]
MQLFDLTAERERLALTADCSNCFGLCCVAHGFKVSASFALNKPARQPCPNLLADFGCAIHRNLRPAGFSGCTAYTCYGAGQQVAQEMFDGKDWR